LIHSLSNSSTSRPFDVCIIGAGIAGLASALALLERAPHLNIAVLSPQRQESAGSTRFGSNQPGIASHPHFSKDHNLLSQWTTFSLPYNDAALQKATQVDPSITLARGRWQVALSMLDAIDIQSRIVIFNDHVEPYFQAQWRADVGRFGALWLPSAWAISPVQLQLCWMTKLRVLNCTFLNGLATKIVPAQRVTIFYKTDAEPVAQLSAEKVLLCSPASTHALLGADSASLALSKSLPMVQWAGQSTLEKAPARATLFGRATVQNESYAIPMGNDEWLVRDEMEQATEAFRGDRWPTPDRLPYVGPMFDIEAIESSALRFAKNDLLPLPRSEHVYLNTGHGTRGLLSGIAGAAIVSEMLLGANTSLTPALANALNPNRYVRRALRSYFANLQ
jgi:tRNA 5-methylaminomethyl-2-thiouridine biosynthesis bifunctional protein